MSEEILLDWYEEEEGDHLPIDQGCEWCGALPGESCENGCPEAGDYREDEADL